MIYSFQLANNVHGTAALLASTPFPSLARSGFLSIYVQGNRTQGSSDLMRSLRSHSNDEYFDSSLSVLSLAFLFVDLSPASK